ncbi:TIGR03016 family PEP-CTERM system-associated outer membrane protein [Magnetospirillum molischianum]|uniref:TIGR03016 family PEP-CTERM system-associated outer membrane protein n=1 Tax=Magnetospirillum molischianum DSM 120 TaxID=1150626 RepID=H8FQB3_MAGML|nr:TIGR03016 family PEP-CTERM system-associated outer membrane protein [Magnetospirillum molischianum]CCG40551.1 exported hypothetical protein [Magnetospirillum molischianum DSM 120]
MRIKLKKYTSLWPFFLFASLVQASAVHADDWSFTPKIALEEKWTDNAFSAPRQTKSDFITTATPGLAISGKGRDLTVGLDYTLSYDRYATYDELSGVRHRGNGVANAQIVEDLLFLDLRGNISEQQANPAGPGTAVDRTSASSNTNQVTTYSINPQVKHRFGPWAAGVVSYAHNETITEASSTTSSHNTPSLSNSALYGATGNGGMANSVVDSGKASLRSGEEFTRMQWGVTSEAMRSEHGSKTFSQTTQTLDNEIKISHEFGFLSQVGVDSLSGSDLDSDKYSGLFYAGGIHWAPSAKNDLRLEFGRRYGSLSSKASVAYAIGPFTQLKLSHTSGVSTDALQTAGALSNVQRDELGRFVDPFSGLAANPASSPFASTNAVYKQRKTEMVLIHRRERDTLTLLTSLNTRDGITAPSTFGAAGTTVLPVANMGQGSTTAMTSTVAWTHQLTPIVSSTATLSQSDIISAPVESGKSQRLNASLDLTYQMNPTLASSVGYHYMDVQPNSSSGVTENVVVIGLRKKF